jgi:4-amino-4-deoxy-L-arabinose transferase-like glycosyltransferase
VSTRESLYIWRVVDIRARLVRVLIAAYCGVILYGVFCTVSLSLERALGFDPIAGFAAGAVVAAVVLWLALRRGDDVAGVFDRVVDSAAGLPVRTWILIWIGIGCLLRLGWGLAVPHVPTSDYLSYLRLAESLVERGEYWLGHTCFLRPPGVSFALTPLVAVFGAETWVPLVQNLLLYCATVVVVFALARQVMDDRVARLSVVVLALWPNGVMLSGLASKELLLLLLVPTTVLVYLRGAEEELHKPGLELAAGLLLGACVLTQPAFLMLAGVFLIYELLRESGSQGAVRRLALLAIGTVLVVSPWTLRNYRASGEFVLVSANGGQTLWVANNPQATGGFVSVDDDRGRLDEITYDRLAFRRAVSWIRDNPGRFLALALRKQILFLGDDSDGPYWVIKRGLEIGDLRYAIAKGIANAFWIGVLALGVVSIVYRRRAHPASVLLMLPLLVQFVVFSITESGGRHHAAIMALIAIVSASIVSSMDKNPPR